jgi:hypothetical protein
MVAGGTEGDPLGDGLEVEGEIVPEDVQEFLHAFADLRVEVGAGTSSERAPGGGDDEELAFFHPDAAQPGRNLGVSPATATGILSIGRW